MDFQDILEYTWFVDDKFLSSLSFFLFSVIPMYLHRWSLFLPIQIIYVFEGTGSFLFSDLIQSMVSIPVDLWNYCDSVAESVFRGVAGFVHGKVLKFVWFYHWFFKWIFFMFPKWSTDLVFNHWLLVYMFKLERVPIEELTFRIYPPRNIFIGYLVVRFFYRRFFPHIVEDYLKGVWRSETEPLVQKLIMHVVHKRRWVRFKNPVEQKNFEYYRSHWPDYYDLKEEFRSRAGYLLGLIYSFTLVLLRFFDFYVRIHSVVIGLVFLPFLFPFFVIWDLSFFVRSFFRSVLRNLVCSILEKFGVLINFCQTYYFFGTWVVWTIFYVLVVIPFNFIFSVGVLTPFMWLIASPIYLFFRKGCETLFDWWDWLINTLSWFIFDIAVPVFQAIDRWDRSTDMMIEVNPAIEFIFIGWVFKEIVFFFYKRFFFNRWYYVVWRYLIYLPIAYFFALFKIFVYVPYIRPKLRPKIRVFRLELADFLRRRKSKAEFLRSQMRLYLRRKILPRLKVLFRGSYLYRRLHRFSYYRRIDRLWSIDYRYIRKNRFSDRGANRLVDFELFRRLNDMWALSESTRPDYTPFEYYFKIERKMFYDFRRSVRVDVEKWVDEVIIGRPYFAAFSSVFRLFIATIVAMFLLSKEGWSWFWSTVPVWAYMYAEIYVVAVVFMYLYFASNWFRYWFVLNTQLFFAIVFCCWQDSYLLPPFQESLQGANLLFDIYLYPNFFEGWYEPLKWAALKLWDLSVDHFFVFRDICVNHFYRILVWLDGLVRLFYSDLPGLPLYEDNFSLILYF